MEDVRGEKAERLRGKEREIGEEVVEAQNDVKR